MAEAQPRDGLRRGILAGVLVLLFLIVFTMWQALVVKNALTEAAADLQVATEKLTQGRERQALSRLEAAASSASRAQRNTTGPIWWSARYLPDIGDDIAAVRTVSVVADELLGETLPPLVEADSPAKAEAFRPVRGRFDLERIQAAQPMLADTAAAVSEAHVQVASLKTSGLIVPLRTRVLDVQEKLSFAASATTAAATAAELMPTMLGGEGKRTYLLQFQNNAEIRAQGGMPGALALIEAKNGKLSMVRQGGPADLIGAFPDPTVSLSQEEINLFTTRAAIYPQDTVFIPDFTRSSQLLSSMWEQRQPQDLDGTVSVDPVALSYMLRATGPVELAGGTVLTAENASTYLMRDVYLEVPSPRQQDEIFADAARRSFEAVTRGSAQPATLLSALGQATSERRLMLWSDREDELSALSGTAIAGELPVDPNDRPELGVYVNDSAADKLSAYLDYKVDVEARSCSAARQTLDVTVTMTSSVPEDVALPPSVVGPITNPTRPGEMLNSIYLYAPPGGYVASAQVGGEEVEVAEYVYRGRDVGALTVGLRRGETKTIEYEVRTGAGQTAEPHLITTPGALGSGRGTVGPSAC